MSDSLITISTYENAIEAEIAKGRLESEGIPAFVLDSHTVNINWALSNAMGGVRLSVRQSDFQKASEILGITYQNLPNANWGSCPKCGSKELEPQTYTPKLSLLGLLWFIPSIFRKTQFLCKSCGALVKSP